MARLARFRWMAGLAIIALALFTAHDAAAKKKKKGKKRTVALFPFVVLENPNGKVVTASADLLTKATAFIDQVEIVQGKALKKKLKKPPGKLAKKCGADLGCLAGLGKKAKADEVLLVRAKPAGKGVALSCVVIAVSDGSLARKMKLEITKVAEVKSVLGGALFELFGITDPGFIEIAGNTGAVKVDGTLVGTGAGPFEVAPGRHDVTVAGETQAVMIMPGKTRNIESAGTAVADAGGGGDWAPGPGATELEEAPPEPEETEIAAVDGDAGEDLALEDLGGLELEAPPEPTEEELAAMQPLDEGEPSDTPVLTIVGGSLAGVGLIVGVVGGIMGAGAAGKQADAEAATVQIDAQRLQDEGNDAATLANVFFIVGGVLFAGGATLAVLDLFVLEPEVSVEAGGAASVGARITW